MGVPWTAEREKRMMTYAAKAKNLNMSRKEAEAVVAMWKKDHGDNDLPTPRAVQERFNGITGSVGTGKKGSPSKNMNGSAPRTPNKPKAKAFTTKTPTSGASKRKHASLSDDDLGDGDEDEDESAEALAANLGRRESIPRSSKSAKKSHNYDEGSDDDADGESETPAGTDKADKAAPGNEFIQRKLYVETSALPRERNSPFDEIFAGLIANSKHVVYEGADRKKARHADEFEDDSDISDFDPSA